MELKVLFKELGVKHGSFNFSNLRHFLAEHAAQRFEVTPASLE